MRRRTTPFYVAVAVAATMAVLMSGCAAGAGGIRDPGTKANQAAVLGLRVASAAIMSKSDNPAVALQGRERLEKRAGELVALLVGQPALAEKIVVYIAAFRAGGKWDDDEWLLLIDDAIEWLTTPPDPPPP